MVKEISLLQTLSSPEDGTDKKKENKTTTKRKTRKNKQTKKQNKKPIFELDILILKCPSDFFFIYLFFLERLGDWMGVGRVGGTDLRE